MLERMRFTNAVLAVVTLVLVTGCEEQATGWSGDGRIVRQEESQNQVGTGRTVHFTVNEGEDPVQAARSCVLAQRTDAAMCFAYSSRERLEQPSRDPGFTCWSAHARRTTTGRETSELHESLNDPAWAAACPPE